jgi:hypothetical protein
MKHGNKHMQDVSWEIEQKKYVIHNVPFKVYQEYFNDEVYHSDVTLKLLLLKDLMEADEIPSNIDFQEAMDIQFE